MKHKVKVTLKDGTTHEELFDSEQEVKAYIEYITMHLKNYITNTEIMEVKDDRQD